MSPDAKDSCGDCACLGSAAGVALAQDAKTTIEDATKAIGAVGLTSITYSGAAATANFGQSRTISFGLSSTSVRSYTRTIDFAQPASRATGATMPPAVRGGPPPQPGTLDQAITPANPAWAQQLQIWLTPWGFLRGAAANNATVRSRKIEGVTYRVVTWSPAQKAPSGQPYKIVGYINGANIVERSRPGWSTRSSETCTSSSHTATIGTSAGSRCQQESPRNKSAWRRSWRRSTPREPIHRTSSS